MNDYYSTLGVNKNASKEDIKKAYKKLAKQYHPDISKSSKAEEKMKEINVAYEALMKTNTGTFDNFFEDDYFFKNFSPSFVFMENISFGKNIGKSTLVIDFSNSLTDEDVAKVLHEIHKLNLKIIGHSYVCKSGVS